MWVLLQLLVLSCLARLHSALWTETLRLQVCDVKSSLSCIYKIFLLLYENYVSINIIFLNEGR